MFSTCFLRAGLVPKGKELMMKHPFYCQMDYRNLPFHTPFNPDKTQEITACVCASSMMIERMLDLCFPPEECFRFAQHRGLEDCTGSLFPVFCGALAGRFSMRVSYETDLSHALERLKGPGAPWVLLPVLRSGETPGERLPHAVLLNGAQEDGFLMLDPMYRPGKGNRHTRRNHLRVQGDQTLVSLRVLEEEYALKPIFVFERS